MSTLFLHCERIQELFSMDSLSVVLKDRANNIVKMNQQVAEKLMLDKEDFDSVNCYDLLGDQAKKLHDDDLKVFQTREPILGEIDELILPDNTSNWVKTDKIPVLDSKGEVINILILSQDITEEMEAKKRVVELEDMAAVGLELSETIHNIKNQLQLIQLSSSALRRKYGANEELDKIENSFKTIINVVEDLVSNTEDKPLISLNKAIEKALDEIEVTKDRRVKDYVRLDFYEECNLRIRHSSIYQVFLNLINNAVDALEGKKGKQISITLKKIGKYILLSIEDNGVGIAPENLGKVFDVYFSTKKATNSLESGSGLGLSYVKRVIADNNGEIEVFSEPGVKTTFLISFDTEPVLFK